MLVSVVNPFTDLFCGALEMIQVPLGGCVPQFDNHCPSIKCHGL